MTTRKYTVLVIGSGGREHALVWKLAQSSQVGQIYVAPGNGGTTELAKNVEIAVTDFPALIKFAQDHDVVMTIVGPDDPLALGIVDAFQAAGLRIFGPSKAAAQIEASKVFAKKLMQQSGVATATYAAFQDYDKARTYLRKQSFPLVIKASGLALGKGVYIAQNLKEAEQALKELMLDHLHSSAGDEVVIEEYLEGDEISIHAFCDGQTAVLFPSAQDHKRIGEGDTGRNTGGMGVVAPLPWVSPELLQQIHDDIIQPILQELAKDGTPFVGCLYPGLMLTNNGPKVLEFNARFGDPETQAYLRLLQTDLYQIFDACIDGKLAHIKVDWQAGAAACLVLASEGYPGSYPKGLPITGLDQLESEIVVFQAGTKYDDEQLVTNGGRVLNLTAVGPNLEEALKQVYQAATKIHFQGCQYRHDIGQKAVAKGHNFGNTEPMFTEGKTI